LKVSILRYIEGGNLFNAADAVNSQKSKPFWPTNAFDELYAQGNSLEVASYTCPSSGWFDNSSYPWMRHYFACGGGATESPLDSSNANETRTPTRPRLPQGFVYNNGIFAGAMEIKLSRNSDGTSNTFAFGEADYPHRGGRESGEVIGDF